VLWRLPTPVNPEVYEAVTSPAGWLLESRAPTTSVSPGQCCGRCCGRRVSGI